MHENGDLELNKSVGHTSTASACSISSRHFFPPVLMKHSIRYYCLNSAVCAKRFPYVIIIAANPIWTNLYEES